MTTRRALLTGGCCAVAAALAGVPILMKTGRAAPPAPGQPVDPVLAGEFARQRFLDHFNCAIAVLEAFAPAYGLGMDELRRLATPFAAGMWLGKTCGAVTGGIMVLGLAHGRAAEHDDAADKAMPGLVRAYTAGLQEQFGPDLDCSALLGADMSTPEGLKQAADKGLFTSFCPKIVAASAMLAAEQMNVEKRA